MTIKGFYKIFFRREALNSGQREWRIERSVKLFMFNIY